MTMLNDATDKRPAWRGIEEFYGGGSVYVLSKADTVLLRECEFYFWNTKGSSELDYEVISEIVIIVGAAVPRKEAGRRLRRFREGLMSAGSPSEDSQPAGTNSVGGCARLNLHSAFKWMQVRDIVGSGSIFFVSREGAAQLDERAYRIDLGKRSFETHRVEDDVVVILGNQWKPKSMARVLRRFTRAFRDGDLPSIGSG